MTFNSMRDIVGQNQLLDQIKKAAALPSAVQKIKDLEDLYQSNALSRALNSANQHAAAIEKAMRFDGVLKTVIENQREIRDQMALLPRDFLGIGTINATYELPANLTVLGDLKKTISMQKDIALEVFSNSLRPFGKSKSEMFDIINKSIGTDKLNISVGNYFEDKSKLDMDSIVSKILLGDKSAEIIKQLSLDNIANSAFRLHEPHGEYYSDSDDEKGSGSIDSDSKIFQAIESATDSNKIANLIAQLSNSGKALLTFILIFMYHQSVNFINGVGSNIAAPIIQERLSSGADKSQKNQAKEFRKMSFGELGIFLQSNRFVTAATLNLYVNPNSKSSVISSLKFGQVVTVITIQKDWTKISYEYGDGEVISGWVFTRYLEKFRR